MSDTHDFPAFLRHAMDVAGYASAMDLSRASGVDNNAISRWLRGGAPSVDLLRGVAPYIHVPLRDLVVRAQIMSAEEVGMERDPAPPLTTEDKIRADPRLTADKQDVLIRLLETLREGHSARTSVRTRRDATDADQPIDMDVTEELSG